MIFSTKGDRESALVGTVETKTKKIMNQTDVLTKIMGYWLLAGNGCSARCSCTYVSLRIHWPGGPSVKY